MSVMFKAGAVVLGLMVLVGLALASQVGLNQRQGEAPLNDVSAPPIRLVFFGDSITEAGDRPGGYVSIIRDTLTADYGEGSVEIIGAGIAGDKVTDLQARVERDVIARSPTHVVIYIGINDVWHDEFEGLTGTDPNAYQAGLRDLIETLQATGAEAMLCTPSVIGEDPDSDASTNQRLMTYAELSRTVAAQTGSPVCDLRVAFEQYLRVHNPDKVYDSILTTDGVHLNPRGNRFVAEVVLEDLRPWLN